MRRGNPVLQALGFQEKPRVTYGPNGGPTKPRPASAKQHNRSKNKAAAKARRRNR